VRRWGSTTSTSNSKTPYVVGDAILKVSTILETKLSDSLSHQPNINILRPFIYDAQLLLIEDENLSVFSLITESLLQNE
jgi:hypothetical protein